MTGNLLRQNWQKKICGGYQKIITCSLIVPEGKEFLLDHILNLGIDGIEAFSSYHNLEQTEYYYQIAQEKRFMSLVEVT